MKQKVLTILILLFAVFFSGCSAIFNKNNKAGLRVLVNDTDASIFLDGQYLEKSPYLNKELKPGQYVVRIEPDDDSLVPYETSVNLRKGLLTVITWKPGKTSELSGGVIYELEKLGSARQTELSIVSIPDGAVVSVDNGEKEFSPILKSDIEAGTHDITISLPSYETQNHTVNVVEGHRLNVLVTLAKNPLESDEDDEQIETATSSANLNETEDASESADIINEAEIELENETENNLESVSLDGDLDTTGTVTITSTNFFQDGEEVLRVRDAVGASGRELGFAPVGGTYPYLGETSQGWYKIDFEGDEAWVSGRYADLQEN